MTAARHKIPEFILYERVGSERGIIFNKLMFVTTLSEFYVYVGICKKLYTEMDW